MDVSFSANTWKHFEIKNIDLNLQEEFYASTPYNINDFKQTSKPPCPIFQVIDSNLLQNKDSLQKQLIKNQNLSLAIFVTYLYEFFHQVKSQIQKKSNYPQNKNKILSEPHLKTQKSTNDQQIDKETDRKLISPQKNNNKMKHEEFEVLEKFKLKIYEIDLCRLKNVPDKFIKYYNNNLLKKILFQYLSKALYNMSLVEILLESNEVLCFALSLVSQSLLLKNQKITTYNENQNFYDEAFVFLEHFDSIEDPCLLSAQKASASLPSKFSTQSKYLTHKEKGQDNNIKSYNFMNFSLSQIEMKSKNSIFKEDGFDGSKKYTLCLLQSKKEISKKAKSQNRAKSKSTIKQSPRKWVSSSKLIQLKSNKKLKEVSQEKSWLKYLGCLRYFFRDNKKK